MGEKNLMMSPSLDRMLRPRPDPRRIILIAVLSADPEGMVESEEDEEEGTVTRFGIHIMDSIAGFDTRLDR